MSWSCLSMHLDTDVGADMLRTQVRLECAQGSFADLCMFAALQERTRKYTGITALTLLIMLNAASA